MSYRKLSKHCIVAMRAVRYGADVFNPKYARHLREVQNRFPDFVIITPPISDRRINGRPAYFGACLTRAGLDFIGPNKPARHRARLTVEAVQ